jgi:hypothetical protein
MHASQSVNLTRDVEANVVPVGTQVTLLKGETAHITQSLGSSFTVVVNGNMFRIDGKDADALGVKLEEKAAVGGRPPRNREQVETEAWAQMKESRDEFRVRHIVEPRFDLRLPCGAPAQRTILDEHENDYGAAWARCVKPTACSASKKSKN